MTHKDLYGQMSVAVREFVDAGSFQASMTVNPVIYLEFPDVGTMHEFLSTMLRDYGDMFMLSKPLGGPPYEYIDDHTVKFTPYAGVELCLSCKQRFAVKMGGSVGFRDIAFVSLDEK